MTKKLDMFDKSDKKNAKNLPKTAGVRVNDEIKAKQVRLIDENGDMIGVLPIQEALHMAKSNGLDLVEVNFDKETPVCKILDYGRYLYSLKKKKHDSKKKQKNTSMKELYIHIGIAEHDYQVKLKKLRALLEDKCKVKIGVKLRGRELAYSDKALILLNKFYDDLGGAEAAKIELNPKLEGNNAIVIFAPILSLSEKEA